MVQTGSPTLRYSRDSTTGCRCTRTCVGTPHRRTPRRRRGSSCSRPGWTQWRRYHSAPGRPAPAPQTCVRDDRKSREWADGRGTSVVGSPDTLGSRRRSDPWSHSWAAYCRWEWRRPTPETWVGVPHRQDSPFTLPESLLFYFTHTSLTADTKNDVPLSSLPGDSLPARSLGVWFRSHDVDDDSRSPDGP